MVFLKKLIYKAAIALAQNSSPKNLQKISETRAVSIFNQSAASLPYYQNLPDTRRQKIENIEGFKDYVPIVDKESVFYQNLNLEKSLFEDDQNEIQSILLSSGSSGSFSFGINTKKDSSKNAEFINILFDHYFQILCERTLIINCLAQAVKLPSTNSVTIELGPRTDSLLYTLEKFSGSFAQTIIIGDNYFLKNSLEEGLALGLDYSKIKLHLIVGGVYLPESLRTYLSELTGIQFEGFEKGSIISSMGISEFGLNLFFETPETISLRRLVQKDFGLQNKVLPAGFPFYLPMFFNYFPQSYFLEEEAREIIITNLNSSAKLPLIRYNTHDKGKIICYLKLKELLKSTPATEMLPPFKSPLVLMYGKDESIDLTGTKIFPQQIQEGLYSDSSAAKLTTGYFRLSKNSQDLKQAKFEIQLKKGLQITEGLTNCLKEACLKNLPSLNIDFIPYAYHDFPYGMELDYERKFKYI